MWLRRWKYWLCATTRSKAFRALQQKAKPKRGRDHARENDLSWSLPWQHRLFLAMGEARASSVWGWFLRNCRSWWNSDSLWGCRHSGKILKTSGGIHIQGSHIEHLVVWVQRQLVKSKNIFWWRYIFLWMRIKQKNETSFRSLNRCLLCIKLMLNSPSEAKKT